MMEGKYHNHVTNSDLYGHGEPKSKPTPTKSLDSATYKKSTGTVPRMSSNIRELQMPSRKSTGAVSRVPNNIRQLPMSSSGRNRIQTNSQSRLSLSKDKASTKPGAIAESPQGTTKHSTKEYPNKERSGQSSRDEKGKRERKTVKPGVITESPSRPSHSKEKESSEDDSSSEASSKERRLARARARRRRVMTRKNKAGGDGTKSNDFGSSSSLTEETRTSSLSLYGSVSDLKSQIRYGTTKAETEPEIDLECLEAKAVTAHEERMNRLKAENEELKRRMQRNQRPLGGDGNKKTRNMIIAAWLFVAIAGGITGFFFGRTPGNPSVEPPAKNTPSPTTNSDDGPALLKIASPSISPPRNTPYSPSATLSPTSTPSIVLLPPNDQECTAIRNNETLTGQDSMVVRTAVIVFEVTLTDQMKEEEWLQSLVEGIQYTMIPRLVGCQDTPSRNRRLLGDSVGNGLIDRSLQSSRLRYVIANANAFLADKDDTGLSCPSGSPQSCHRTVVNLQFYLKADVDHSDLTSLLNQLLVDTNSNSDTAISEETLGLPALIFHSVNVANLQVEAFTRAPSDSPSTAPSASPSTSPSTPSKPTMEPTLVPSTGPSSTPSLHQWWHRW
mmetsp:Transcript_43830/g.105727  ORF Transcript_43830/g.105727 Transcript_43830/m.105727 type:complete len:614 (-) Transcript_43830:422-2263(-)